MSEYERNLEVAQRICRDQRWNGAEFRLGDYVGLLRAWVICRVPAISFEGMMIAILADLSPLPLQELGETCPDGNYA